ncbi:hypothetical protein HUG15_21095 [Salicibibacter cibarius]|uniref:Uncharacterized protein n=1 Tax=Salicibibacter cibarius TaxID=2743000 RepID=A0A7T6Z6Q0_9BACI|nr:hypothetical protein [Salicibibacter cibarius]QQK77827.1 hypothetical protein HUG15_21095 [Salicibibacter cibarius]
MSERKRMNLRVLPHVMDYIDDYREQHDITYNGQALEKIIQEHEAWKIEDRSNRAIMNMAAEQFRQVFDAELKKLQLGVNNADRNTQILIELMNGMLMNEDHLITTSNMESQPVSIAKDEIKERIAHQRQKKMDWEESRKAKQTEGGV